MNRKIFLIISILCFALTVNVFAQQRNNRNDQQRKADFEAFKVKRENYISKEMGMTEEESKAFWPLCNELQEKKFQINRDTRKEVRTIYEALKKGQKVSEADYDKMIRLNAEAKIKEAELDKEYLTKFRKFLSAEKVYKYQRAEQRFAREMANNSERQRK